MRQSGPEKLQVVTDFDFTLTTFCTATGERGASCHKIIEDCGLLSEESYHPQAQALQQKYYPLEVDPDLDMDTKIKYMVEWVTQAHALLQENGLTQRIVATAARRALRDGKVGFRAGVDRFLATLAGERVPSLIFSAGLADVLEELLKYQMPDLQWSLLNVISNRCIFDGPDGSISGFIEPMIHVFNKRSATFLDTDFFRRDDTLQRTSLLLLGDSLGDLKMSQGMTYDVDAALKIGFLNDRPERLPQYLAAGSEGFDLVVLGDPGFQVPNGLLDFITGDGGDSAAVL